MTSYGFVAHEYYDPVLHPTCANFGYLSRLYIEPEVRRFYSGRTARKLLEVGVGRSILAPVVHQLRGSLGGVILVDLSPEMLAHSAEWGALGAELRLADARDTRLPSRSIDLIVASLGDPYNTPEFWKEVRRVLAPTGVCLFTTPAYEWASKFRPVGAESGAEFELRDGRRIVVPSFVPDEESQRAMLERADLRVDGGRCLTTADLTGSISPKVAAVDTSGVLPVVRGLRITPSATS